MGGSITSGTRSTARAGMVLAAVAALLGCSHDPPTKPPGTFAITGHVRLTGYLVAPDGHFAGTRIVDDAGGVEVELRLGSTSSAARSPEAEPIASTDCTRGLRGVCERDRDVADQTKELTIVHRDLMSGDTLNLDVTRRPLPRAQPLTRCVVVYFDVPDSADVDVLIVDLAGRIVQHVFSQRVQGLQQVLWTGRDEAGELVTDRMHWITYEAGDDKRAQLLFR
jgi:hypothetical protein